MRLAALVLFMIGGAQMAYGQSSIDEFGPLVELTARRLALAERVARVKWARHMPVEDVRQESQVIASAIDDSQSTGLDAALIVSFFGAQIEANKLVQYARIADWYRAGTGNAQEPVDALEVLRQRFDTLQVALIGQLAETAGIRQSMTCRADIAKAVGRYLASHPQRAGTLFGVALDRALVATCTG